MVVTFLISLLQVIFLQLCIFLYDRDYANLQVLVLQMKYFFLGEKTRTSQVASVAVTTSITRLKLDFTKLIKFVSTHQAEAQSEVLSVKEIQNTIC